MYYPHSNSCLKHLTKLTGCKVNNRKKENIADWHTVWDKVCDPSTIFNF